jgi:hypothetical protein
VEAARLEPECRSLAKDASKSLLANERNRPGSQLGGDARQTVGRPLEVGATELAGARRRPVRRVREPVAVAQELSLLARVEAPRSEAGFVEQSPEIVARVGEVVPYRRRAPARVDPTEDDSEPRRENVWNSTRQGPGTRPRPRIRHRSGTRHGPDTTASRVRHSFAASIDARGRRDTNTPALGGGRGVRRPGRPTPAARIRDRPAQTSPAPRGCVGDSASRPASQPDRTGLRR